MEVSVDLLLCQAIISVRVLMLLGWLQELAMGEEEVRILKILVVTVQEVIEVVWGEVRKGVVATMEEKEEVVEEEMMTTIILEVKEVMTTIILEVEEVMSTIILEVEEVMTTIILEVEEMMSCVVDRLGVSAPYSEPWSRMMLDSSRSLRSPPLSTT